MDKTYTIVTPIYYVNAAPHIGTSLTTILSDMTSRYQRLQGKTPFFLTGTDENGLKVREAAVAQGRDPVEFVGEIAEDFKKIWERIGIGFDDFIRTTEPRHIHAVQEAYRRLKAKGYIYSDKYEGWYDISTETFLKEEELVDGKSPEGNPVTWMSEENDFFKLSAFAEPLLKHIQDHPKFILPESRKNEVVAFINQGLRDICVTRNNPGWGIEVPDMPEKVVYVWFDALINYIAACDWPDGNWQAKWPAEIQWMGKDILTRFHATFWPAILMGLELPLPETLFGHGWVLMGGDKVSKSKGNVIAPFDLAEELSARAGCALPVAIDAVRYYVAATMPVDTDTNFTIEEFDRKYNADLANDLGNALNRSLSMAHQFLQGAVPAGDVEPELQAQIQQSKAGFESAMQDFRPDLALHSAFDLVRFLNKYINDRAPWNLAKSEDSVLNPVMRGMLLALRAAEGMVSAIAPQLAAEIARQLGVLPTKAWSEIGTPESLPGGTHLEKPAPIYPRLQPAKPTPKEKAPAEPKQPKAKSDAPVEPIDIETFAKVQLKVGRVLEAEPLEGSDKLLILQVMIGEEKRQIVAGIRKSYSPMDLIGRQVIVVANLKPATLRGVESQGMLLAATDTDGSAILLQPEREAPEGTGVK